MVRSLSTRGLPKPLAILIAALLALYIVPLNALPASAATVGGFEIEGNLVDDSAADPPIDWFDLNPGDPGFNTGVDNTTATGQDDTVFSGSSKEYVDAGKAGGWPAWTYGTGNATGKSDFGRWGTYDFVDASNHVWFFLGFDRKAGQGTAKYVFELNQITQNPKTNPNPVRSQGDIRLVVWDQGNGLVTLTPDAQNDDVGLYKWVDADDQAAGATGVDTDNDGAWVKINNNGTFEGASNTGAAPISVPSWWTSGNVTGGQLEKDEFLEFGIDLTSFGAVLGCPSAGFTAVNSRSITGTGGPGTLVDYLEAIPVTIPSSCASLFIKKFKGDGTTALGGATFTITPNPLPVGTPGRPADNFLTIFDDSDANTVKEGTTNYDDPDATAGKISLPVVIPNVEYTITETAAPDGWILDGTVVKKTPVAFGTDQSATNTATFVNHRGSVKFYKDYQGADPQTGASFTLTRDNADADALYNNGTVHVTDNGLNDTDNAIGVIKVDPLDAGSWKLVEDDPGAPTGWLRDSTEVLFTVPDGQGNRDVVLANPTLTDLRATYPLEVKKIGVVPNQADVDIAGAVFNLWRDTNGTAGLQKATDTLAGTCTTAANGKCSVLNQPWGFNYFWEEVSVPAPWNLPSATVQGPVTLNADGSTNPSGPTVFSDPKSKIVTQATNGNLPNATISDTATLSGVNNSAAGQVTFDLYYTGLTTEPTPTSCTQANLVQAGIVGTPNPVNGPGNYSTGPISVSKAGYYAWVAHYSGDANGNRAVDGACDDANETSFVETLQPGITTLAVAVDAQLPGTELYDTAKVSPVTGNLDTAVANVDFALYGPGDTTCTGNPVFTSNNRPVTVVSDGNGGFYAEATSAHYTGANTAGTYRWVAQFDGDGSNKDVDGACNGTNENTDVEKAHPTVTTQAGPDKVLGENGVTLEDTATLAGGTANIKGTITFNLYYFASNPVGDTAACANKTPIATLDVAVDGNGDYQSGGVLVHDAGWYTWTAQYTPHVDGGPDDANNTASAVHGCGLDSETVKVSPIQPTITTEAGADQVVGVDGADLTDTAFLSGGTSPTGKITFKLYGPFVSDPTGDTGACTPGALVDTVEKTGVSGNGQYTSPKITVTKTGYYVWVATYSGDANNLTATHPCGDASEVVKVTPRQPVITTDVPGPNTLPLGASGTSLTDQATLSNSTAGATGTISFQLYGPFDSAPDANSCVDAKKVGAAVNATAPVSGDGTYTSGSKLVSAAGYYTWVATYSGDAENNSATHPCGQASETVLITKAPTSITTEVADPTLQLAPTASLVDTATLSGATVSPAAGGTITFNLYGPFANDPTGNSSVCIAGNLAGSTVKSVSGPGLYTSDPVVVSEAGYYVWQASYSGDANNDPSIHDCGDAKEVTQVDKADTTITTQVPSTTAQLDPTATLTDTATLSGGTLNPAASGTITFTLYGPFASAPGKDSCTEGKAIDTRTATVTGNGSYSPATGITVNETGFYTWVASYSGDANNKPATHDCGLANETVEVGKAPSAITTDAVDKVKLSSGTTTISDVATLSGVTEDPEATGTIEFKVYGPFSSQPGADSCTAGKLVGGGPYTVAVHGPGQYTSPNVQVKLAGYYVWVAGYSGDANNAAATHPCGQTEETTVVDKATPAISTQVADASVDLPNASLVDTATLSGGTSDPKATGTITFRLYGPFASAPNSDSCTEGKLVATKVVAVTDGNGSYISPAVVVTQAGTYTWVATYSGDDNNESATHACGLASETVTVNTAPTDVTTVATGSAIIKLGQTIEDAASVTGLTDDATGTVTFTLYGPDDATCSGEPVFTSVKALTVTVNESGATGSATSSAFAPTAAGTYRWVASYSGDDNNAVSAGECNDPNEQSVVRAGDNPGLDKFSDPASGSVVQPGTTIHYSVKVSNTGDVAITDADVLDILPPHVTVNVSSISDGGVLSADKTRINWTVTLAGGASKTLTYDATVNADAPQGAVLVNTARFQGLEDTTTHVVPTGALTILKQVSPVAGGGVVVEFGDTLTYTLTVTATGTLNQTNVEVKDYIPGYDPARPTSGKTTYVAGSATCVGAGTCTVAGPGANHQLIWSLGTMAAGTSRQVTFKVTIDDVTGAAGETVAVDILNAGAVKSDRTPTTPSNQVVTPVSKVLPVKVHKPPVVVLPHTGATLPVGKTVGGAIALLGLGLLLVAAGRRRSSWLPRG